MKNFPKFYKINTYKVALTFSFSFSLCSLFFTPIMFWSVLILAIYFSLIPILSQLGSSKRPNQAKNKMKRLTNRTRTNTKTSELPSYSNAFLPTALSSLFHREKLMEEYASFKEVRNLATFCIGPPPRQTFLPF